MNITKSTWNTVITNGYLIGKHFMFESDIVLLRMGIIQKIKIEKGQVLIQSKRIYYFSHKKEWVRIKNKNEFFLFSAGKPTDRFMFDFDKNIEVKAPYSEILTIYPSKKNWQQYLKRYQRKIIEK